MAVERVLPEQTNPMLVEDRAPPREILVERRCLGQTELKVKPGQIGTSNATKPDNLGVLDYAHLRVPLPKDLTNSGIFTKGSNRKYPEAYFLMRRSSDGFVSATGMFKAAFPYARSEEELAEKEYIKGMPSASSEEVAGNVWVHPDLALELAEEYGMRLWIEALLDPEPIMHGTNDPQKSIKSPPAYNKMKDMVNGSARSPDKKSANEGKASTRGRRSASVVSDSPSVKSKTPGRPKATPRKPRKGRGTLTSVDEAEPEDVNGDEKPSFSSETVKVEVETVTRPTATGEEEIESTKVNVEMPTGHPDLPLPENTDDMLKTARRMVDEANKLGGPSRGGKGKRKAEEMIDEEADEASLEGPPPTVKKARIMEVELRKERIKRKALTGIAASLAIGALIPSVAAFLAWS